MSHLPLDARAILEYLNELGYRNISAEQLKEFLKGMQPQSEINKNKHKTNNNQQQQQLSQPAAAPKATKATPTASTTRPDATAAAQHHSAPPKLIKGKKPLCYFKFYLDICDHQLTKKIEEQIKKLGGTLEFFLTPSVTHFITDKTVLPPPTFGPNNTTNNSNTAFSSSRPGTPQTPVTPGTPQTPYSLDSYDGGAGVKTNNGSGTPSGSQIRTRQSRADAILNRARRQSTTNSINNTINTPKATGSTNVTTSLELTPNKPPTFSATTRSDSTPPYKVWQTEYALHFFKKVQHELKEYIDSSRARKNRVYAVEPIHLKGPFIKIEATKGSYRPYYQLIKKPTEWPKIEITRDDGAFRLSPKKTLEEQVVTVIATASVAATAEEEQQETKQKMTRKSRSRSSHRQHPLPGAVQALKKVEKAAAKTSGIPAVQRNNSTTMGAGCKQVKESSEKQCGVCEICKIEYDTLTIHLKTKDHEYFAKNSQNFIALDTLIHTSADVNTFLAETKKIELKSELEEMEVEEENTVDVNAVDPLDDSLPVLEVRSIVHEEKGRSSGASYKTPSPTLREKSKRTTKGKHSSEKFQNTLKQPTKSPKTPPKSTSTQKKPSSSTMELQHIDTTAATTGTATMTPAAQKKPSAASTISPPIRAMLPPSSLYKVVETQEICTPLRKTRDIAGDQAIGSPSLIVKFKKVRQAELMRLHGEAENFMFPKRRTSSELPTDVDRQTTSDNVRASVSSASLDSTSEQTTMDAEYENHERAALQQQQQNTKQQPQQQFAVGKKAIAVAKRKIKAKQPPKQSFPNAPIQPEVQLKRLPRTSTMTSPIKAAIAAASTSITLPEATRKSSRTATAIVSAATTSSRLLRAAVEAAKNNSRRLSSAIAAAVVTNNERVAAMTPAAAAAITKPAASSSRRSCAQIVNETSAANERRRCLRRVGKLEDRMGDSEELNTDESDNDEDEENYDDAQDNDEEDEESDDEQEEDDCDDDNDEDYVHNKKKTYYGSRRTRNSTTAATTTPAAETTRSGTATVATTIAISATNRGTRASTKGQRLLTRQPRRMLRSGDNQAEDYSDFEGVELEEEEEENLKRRTAKRLAPPLNSKRASCSPIKKSSPQRFYDHTKSERLHNLRYAFERLPTSDLWYRVFARQDACQDEYFEYFGSTKYRKLPYELGPIPFEHTLGGICCKVCNKGETVEALRNNEATNNAKKSLIEAVRVKKEIEETKPEDKPSSGRTSATFNGAPKTTYFETGMSSSSSATQYTHKHKKLHLLQRYRQEQQELLQKQQLLEERTESKSTTDNAVISGQCDDSKASTPDREQNRIERAGSMQSNTSSCASSSATLSKKQYRNKHLNKAAFLNLELPPRKSPREHASTLALVSCIIKQRQDSQSKSNSEIDEPPAILSEVQPPATIIEEEEEEELKPKVMTPSIPSASMVVEEVCGVAVRSPRATRSAAATPIEELRFATEISETVKRMRRGQNKYDHSPPIVTHAKRGRGRPPSSHYCRGRVNALQKHVISQMSNTVKRRKRRKALLPGTTTTHHYYHHHRHHHAFGSAAGVARHNSIPSIRKTGSKKGVLEFEADASALRALDAAVKHTNVRQLEWEIDKYLQLAGKDYDIDLDLGAKQEDDQPSDRVETAGAAKRISKSDTRVTRSEERSSSNLLPVEVITPPPTEYFSSDFDLCDLFTSSHTNPREDDEQPNGKSKNFSLYNSVALNNYFRKRKSLKSNRTGWPKVQKKKCSTRQHHLRQKIRFMQGGIDGSIVNGVAATKQEPIDDAVDDENTKAENQQQNDGAMTPPDSELEDEIEEEEDVKTVANEEEDDDTEIDDDDTEIDDDAGESIPYDADTVVDSIEEDADIEAEDDDDDEGEEEEGEECQDAAVPGATTTTTKIVNGKVHNEDNDALEAEEEEGDEHEEQEQEDDYEPMCKRTRRFTIASPSEKLSNSLTAPATATSTPTTQMLRGLRRTPQLNGSLGSCISPSEKAGDNSDIFTVSSDGLDTDHDLSNSHSQLKGGGIGGGTGGIAEDEHHHEHCPNRTPKRKFDISKYAPHNKRSSTCAAEAATAAVKSLAISQFLKKEVRVTCRRLKAPFRRFRYRR